MRKIPTQYRDRPFRLVAAFAGALIATEFGGTSSIFKRLLSKWFYSEFGTSLVIALIVVECVAFITRRLDRHWDWKEKPIPRTCLQILLGILLPGGVTFLLAALYFYLYDMNILTDTYYVIYSLPFVFALITLFNVYYLTYYFYLQGRKAPESRKVLIVSSGSKNIPMPVEDIGFIYRKNDGNFLKTFNGETYILSQSLDELQQQLDSRLFFRVNRQMIVNIKACKYFELASYGKLELILEPPFLMPVIISQLKAATFKKWMEH